MYSPVWQQPNQDIDHVCSPESFLEGYTIPSKSFGHQFVLFQLHLHITCVKRDMEVEFILSFVFLTNKNSCFLTTFFKAACSCFIQLYFMRKKFKCTILFPELSSFLLWLFGLFYIFGSFPKYLLFLVFH